jgi:glycosyltransferase involved in cell wall biosynthesis
MAGRRGMGLVGRGDRSDLSDQNDRSELDGLDGLEQAPPEVTVLIPAYNERATIREVIRRVLAQPCVQQVIVVDDGSSDGTRELLQETEWPPIVTVRYHERNMGKGAAIRTGVQAANKDVTIIQDADLEYNPKDYAVLLRPIGDGVADVVYGSRFLGIHRSFLLHHYIGNKVLTWTTNVLYNNILTDMETGYKAFRTPILKGLCIRSNRFDFEPEITAKVSKKGFRIYEVPIYYAGRDYDEGKKITWRDGFTALWALIRFRFAD